MMALIYKIPLITLMKGNKNLLERGLDDREISLGPSCKLHKAKFLQLLHMLRGQRWWAPAPICHLPVNVLHHILLGKHENAD